MAMMDDDHELLTLGFLGIEVTSYALELVGTSSNQANRRPLDDCFSVELLYHHVRNSDPEEEEIRSMVFRLKKESHWWDLQSAVINWCDRIGVDEDAYDVVIDVVAKSCDMLLEEVSNFGRKSLAMTVKICVDEQQLLEAEAEEGILLFDEDGLLLDLDEVRLTEAEEMMGWMTETKDCLWRNGVGFAKSDDKVVDDIIVSGCCAICLEEFEESSEVVELAVLPCCHVIHTECLVPWVFKEKDSCPLCRTKLLHGR